MLFHIAAGVKIDTQRSEKYLKKIEEYYRNPFVQVRKAHERGADIVDYIYKRVEEAKQWIS